MACWLSSKVCRLTSTFFLCLISFEYELTAQCPSCFPNCNGQSFTSVPACNNPTHNGGWCVVSANFYFVFVDLSKFNSIRSHRDLNSNQITSITNSSFSGLGLMTGLCVAVFFTPKERETEHSFCRQMSSNQISSIESGSFQPLTDLYSLCARVNLSICPYS